MELQNTINFNKKLRQDHVVKVLAGMEYIDMMARVNSESREIYSQ